MSELFGSGCHKNAVKDWLCVGSDICTGYALDAIYASNDIARNDIILMPNMQSKLPCKLQRMSVLLMP